MGWLKGRRSDEPVDDEIVIDLRDKPEFGTPVPCPECGRPGYLDKIDVRRGVAHQHCVVCRATWVTHDEGSHQPVV